MGDYGYAAARNPDAGVQPRAKASNRANVIQQKLIGQSHPTGLTANLLKLFEPRPPPEYKPPVEKRKLPAYTGIAHFVSQFAEPGDPAYAPPVVKGETKAEKKDRIRQLKLEEGAAKVAEDHQKYDPQSDPNATGDPYKTLLVARLSYETSERKIKREFEAYGPIRRVRLVTEKETNKPRGYAFVEYVHTRDMKNAYKQADERKVDNKRVLVDVERGRTVPNWRPRRLGGGLGSSRIGGEGADHRHAARVQQLAGRPRSEEPRSYDHRADRGREKSRDRTCEHSHDRTRDRESKEDRHSHRNRDRTRDKDRERVRERDRGHDLDHDRRDGDKHRHHGREDRERGRERSRDRHHDRDRNRDRDYERAAHQRDRGHLRDRDAEYGNGDPRHERNMPDYSQDDVYNLYEQRKSHDAYGGQDGHGHETKGSKRHEHEYHREDSYSKMTANYQVQPNNTESEAPEEGEAYEEGGYQFHRADEYRN